MKLRNANYFYSIDFGSGNVFTVGKETNQIAVWDSKNHNWVWRLIANFQIKVFRELIKKLK